VKDLNKGSYSGRLKNDKGGETLGARGHETGHKAADMLLDDNTKKPRAVTERREGRSNKSRNQFCRGIFLRPILGHRLQSQKIRRGSLDGKVTKNRA